MNSSRDVFPTNGEPGPLPTTMDLSGADRLMQALAYTCSVRSVCHAVVRGGGDFVSRKLAEPANRRLLAWVTALDEVQDAGRVRWAVGKDAPLLVREVASLDAVVPEALDLPDRPCVATVLRDSRGAEALLFSWDHALLDARGAEMLLARMLAGESRFELFEKTAAAAPAIRPAQIRAFGAFMQKLFSEYRNVYLPRPLGSYERCARTLSLEESRTLEARLQRSGLQTFPSVYFIAASGRALSRVIAGSQPLVIGVPHDARKKGRSQSVFPSRLLTVFFALRDLDRLPQDVQLAELLKQFGSFIGNRLHHCFADLLELGRRLPTEEFARLLHSPHEEGICSCYVSYVGESILERSALTSGGLSLVHHPPHFTPPGLSFVYWWSQARLHISLVVCRELLGAASATSLLEAAAEALIGDW